MRGRPLSAIAAEEIHALLSQMDMDRPNDPVESARRVYLFELLLERVPLSVIEELMSLVGEEGGQLPGISRIFSVYAGRDWARAKVWVEGRHDAGAMRAKAIAHIMRHDENLGMALYEQELNGGDFLSGMDMASRSMAAGFAKQGKEAFFRFLDKSPSISAFTLCMDAPVHLPKEDIPGFVDEVRKRVESGSLPENVLATLVMQTAGAHTGMARKWLATLDKEEQPARAFEIAR
ncbi:MAG: hypothetical protein EOP85_03815, partial [Verrucomicrobiaceae bacterium]